MIINNFFLFFYFVIANIVLFLIPGRFFLDKGKIKLSAGKQILISEVIGIVLFTLVGLLLKILHLPLYLYVILVIFCSKELIRKKSFNFSRFKKDKIAIFLVLIGTFTQNISLLLSGLKKEAGDLVFLSDWAFHDFSWHLALIEELKKPGLPSNPVFKGYLLKDYHYFYNLLLVGFHQITKIATLDLLYRFFPLLVSFLLGISIYLFVKDLTKNKASAQICLFLTYFCGSFGWLIPFFRGRSQDWGESNFWVSQTFSMAIQPHFLLSVVIIFAGLILLSCWPKKKDLGLVVLIAVLFGSVVGFKAYGLLVITGGLVVFSFYQLIVKKEKRIIFLDFLTFLITLVALFPISTGRSTFFWKPLWFPKTMLASPDRFSMVELILKEEHYLAVGNYLRFLQIKIYQLLIFIIGNLGIRFFGFLGLYFFFKNKEKREIRVFLGGASIVVFIFPLLFLQKGAVWNAIQPWYYFLLLMNIFTAEFFSKLIAKKSKIFQFIAVFLILTFSLPTTIKTFYGLNFKAPKVVIANQQIMALKKLKELTKSDNLVLLYPSFRNVDSSLVSALSGRRTFFAHEGQADLFDVDLEKEKEKIRQLFSSKDELLIRNFFIDNKINYVFLWQDETKNASWQFLSLCSQIFENDAALIYKTK